MYCSNCGKKNDNETKFCENCGNKLEVQKEIVNNNVINNNQKKKIPVLSWLSLCFLFAKVAIIIYCIFSNNYFNNYVSNYDGIYDYNGMSGLSYIPFLTTSLILSIVSRVKNKDTMSLVVMVIDIVLFALLIIMIIIEIIFIGVTIIACGEAIGRLY